MAMMLPLVLKNAPGRPAWSRRDVGDRRDQPGVISQRGDNGQHRLHQDERNEHHRVHDHRQAEQNRFVDLKNAGRRRQLGDLAVISRREAMKMAMIRPSVEPVPPR